ncbi:FG-GAP repeat domain-containing protein [Planctomycetota bacterium]
MNFTRRKLNNGERLEGRQLLTMLTFAESQTVGIVDGTATAAFVDLAGDDNVDVVSIGRSTRIHIGDGQGQFEAAGGTVADGGVFGVFDIDGDGNADLTSGSISDTLAGRFRWYRNDPDQRGQFVKVLNWDAVESAANRIDAGDIDGDGDLDLLGSFANVADGAEAPGISSIHWYENTDGKGTFSLRPVDSEGFADNPDPFWRDFAKLTDVDSDGDLDIINNLAWYENEGGGTSFKRHELDGKPLLEIGDVDGDGDVDLITEARNSQVGWRENIDGLGTFAAQRTIDGAIQTIPGAVKLVDMDFDGDLDFLAVDRTSSQEKLSWYENYSGHGDFGREQVIEDRLGDPVFVDAMDIDGDNDIDILTGRRHQRGTRLILLEGLGTRPPGDSNGDGIFNSSDFVHVFQAGEYEDQLNDNSTFEEGDWNGDSEFNSSDFVFVFQRGNYIAEARLNPIAQVFAASADARDRELKKRDAPDDDDDWWLV